MSLHPADDQAAHALAPGFPGSIPAPAGAADLNHQRRALHPGWVLVLASLWLATVCNVALWRELTRLPGLHGGQLLQASLSLGLMIALTTCGLLGVLAWRWTLKPVITLFLFSAAFGAYFMMAYGVVIDPTMMVNTLQTDLRETRDLLNWRMLASVVVLAVLPSVWLWRQPVRRLGALRHILTNAIILIASSALLVLTVMLSFQGFSSLMRNHTHVRYLINPLNSFYALGVIAAKPFKRNETVILPLGEDARLGASYAGKNKPPLLLLVLGETARSGNFSINGYQRPTTPKLARETLVSQRNAWACGTSTAAALPCMFSHLGREGYDARPANYEGLLDVLQRAGLAVLWIDNQSGCKSVCDRVESTNTSLLKVPGLCDGGECFDEVMLDRLDERIAALPAERRARGVVVVMHQMGSHGPAYYKRSPAAFKTFKPECRSNALQQCGRDELINAYDNSIVYSDHFLSNSIQWLKARESRAAPALIYVGDHGESLGENNLYLHGMPNGIAPDVQKRVPWITWLSPSFEQRTKLSMACLNQQRDAPISHDNYFHSVLGVMDVQTGVYRRTLDMYAPCVTP